MDTQDPVEQALQKMLDALSEREQIDSRIQQILKNIKEIAGATTLQRNDKFYQVRERNGTYHICTFNKKPGRPKGVTNKAKSVADPFAFASP